MQVLIVIPARGGSKGIPRKNLRLLGGKPLIYYSIQTALSVKNVDVDVYVSSDDDEILSISKKAGAKCHTRDSALAGDEITLDSVIYDTYEAVRVKKNKDYQLIVTMQPTSPLLRSSSVESAIEEMVQNPTIETLISSKSDAHLSWSKVGDKFVPNYEERLNRQFLKPVYSETGGILITRDSIITKDTRIGEHVQLHVLKDNRETIDIDTYEDWSICEFYLKRKKILFVVTGNQEVGLGHVYNSTLVANDIMEHRVSFLVDSKSQLAYDKIASLNFQVQIQKHDNIVDDIIALEPDIVISDILDTNIEYVQALNDHGLMTINFEDLGEGAREADLVFNAIYPENEKQDNHFYGPDYFCARDEFVLSKGNSVDSEVKKVLLTFGGVDPANLTKKVLSSILPACEEQNIRIDIITGFGYKRHDELKELLSDRVQLHQDIKNISDYMLEADIAFTSGGRTTYELALLGIPTVVICQNEREQKHFFAYESNGFINLGLHSEASETKINEALASLLPHAARKESWTKMQQNNIREGRKNVVTRIKQFIDK